MGGREEVQKKGGRKKETCEINIIFFLNMRKLKPSDDMPCPRHFSNKKQNQN